MTLLRRVRWWHVYLALLGLSHVVQFVASRAGRPESGVAIREVAVQRAAGPAPAGTVRLAYREWGEGAPLIYLHGSPGSGADARRIAGLLQDRFRVIAPDLPGFGRSSRWIPDYGIQAHARYVLELMDELGVERAHFLAHSMGGGVALWLARLAPARVASITSYAGIGVQEREGSGDYYLEHLKYAAGYALLVVAPEVVPHFGLLGSRAARHAFIRNFWDTDQRPLRGILERLEAPLLILHGREDPLVPLAAADEHHRIVEHSELVVLDDRLGHFLVFTDDGSRRLVEQIRPFLDRHSDPAVAPRRRTPDAASQATASGRTASRADPVPRLGPWGQLAAFFWGTFASEDLTCIAAGLLARRAVVDPFVAVLGCFLGIVASDLGLWLVGRVAGRRVLHWRPIARRIPPARVERFGRWLDRHLGRAVFGSRFLPGTRLPVYVAAGTVGRRPLAFVGWLVLAALVWTPLLVGAAIVLGPIAARPFEKIAGVGWVAWGAAATALFVALRVALLALSWRGRARLAAIVARAWQPEFWPTWLFYLPLAPWLAWLAVRHRGITTPTAANPAIPHGGFVGESKYDILRALPPRWTVPSRRIRRGPVAHRLQELRQAFDGDGWKLPVVLKPDEGQRGVGLKLARDWTEVAAYLETHPGDVLAQPYDPGPHEAGIFYYRIPGEPHGRIFSVTAKRFPAVVGDGRSTLEELIWRDGRLRMQAGVFARRHAARLDDVPSAGERVSLAVSGNHCQGTMFLDGARLGTPALERAVDELARSLEGFYFGRFDVRFTDAERLMAGEGFRVVELNGVTSESTNVYDPSYGLLRAWRTLGRQWSLAYRIGALNRRRGHRPSSLAALVRAARRHYATLPADRVSD